MNGYHRAASDSSSQQSSCGTSPKVNIGKNERLYSILGGSTVLLVLARYGSLVNLVGTVLGAGLVYRGLTGHCDLYENMGIDSLDHDERPRTAPQVRSDSDRLDEASEESFPASDSPAWTGTSA